MNILFFLTPKEDVSYLPEDYTLRQALEKMKYHGYSAVPIDRRRKVCGNRDGGGPSMGNDG